LAFGQTIWDKAEVLLGKYWGTTSKLGEPNGNTFGNKETYKNNLPLPSAKQKRTESIACLLIKCMKFLFSKLFIIIFGLS
jgi:hypothetical protein